MSPDGELGLLYFVVPVAPGRSRLLSLPLATNRKFRCGAAWDTGRPGTRGESGMGCRCRRQCRCGYDGAATTRCAAPTPRRLLSRVFHALPWLRHLFNHDVAAQDIAVLHRQASNCSSVGPARPGWPELQRCLPCSARLALLPPLSDNARRLPAAAAQGTNMSAADFQGWRKGFYLPTSSDTGVVVLRRWLEEAAGGGVAWGPNVAAPAGGSGVAQAETRREILGDHFHQHTGRCDGAGLWAWAGLRAGRFACVVECRGCLMSAAPPRPGPLPPPGAQNTARTAWERCAGCGPLRPPCWPPRPLPS